jgi:hypothetical protein
MSAMRVRSNLSRIFGCSIEYSAFETRICKVSTKQGKEDPDEDQSSVSERLLMDMY